MFSTCKSVNDNFNKRSFSHGTVCTSKFKYLLGEPLSWTPFLEKGRPKITEGGQFFFFHSFIGYSSYNIQYKFIIQHKSKKKKPSLANFFNKPWIRYFIFRQINLIFTTKTLHLASFWKWGFFFKKYKNCLLSIDLRIRRGQTASCDCRKYL